MGLARPPEDWAGLDPVLPLLDRLRDAGLVVLVKFDGERTAADPSGPYTVMITGPSVNGRSYRAEKGSLDECVSSALAQYARAIDVCVRPMSVLQLRPPAAQSPFTS